MTSPHLDTDSRDSEPRRLMSQREYLRSPTIYPAPLRDFHDAKDVFKSLHEWMGTPKDHLGHSTPNWVDGMCYVIDHFLRFMAAHGWTMQRSRARVEFASLDATIKARRDREVSVMRAAFAKDATPAAMPDKPIGTVDALGAVPHTPTLLSTPTRSGDPMKREE